MPLELTQAQQDLKTNYQQQKERRATLTNLTLQSTDGRDLPPTPTQEENDLLALGLMHPDDKAAPVEDRGMPPLGEQQQYLLTGEQPPAPSAPPPPSPPPSC